MTVETLQLAGTPETGTGSYRGRVAEAIAAGWRFAGTYADTDGAVVRTLLVADGGATRLASVAVEAGTVPSIVDLVPAAGWDEREAADLHGIGFLGHSPLRPLVNHLELDRWTVPVRGDDAYQVAVGPIHAGIIESGHFRFHLVGDRILHLDARLFYKHRGLEKAAEGTDLEHAARYVARACAACTVSNSLAYAHAWEQALGLVPTGELSRTRTVLLELERVWNLLNDIAAICAGVGLAAGNHHFAALTERARRLNAALAGHRFLFGTVRAGGSDLVADRVAVRSARAELAAIRAAALTGWHELTFNASLADRLPGVGVVPAEQARRLGTVGPAARAAGIAEDARAGCCRLAYEDFRPVLAERGTGDVRARFEQRALELWQSIDILDRLLDRPLTRSEAEPAGMVAEPAGMVAGMVAEPAGMPAGLGGSATAGVPGAIGVGIVESPRGRTSCVVERDGRTVHRLHLRTGSYANWPSVAHAAAGDQLQDFPLINKSFELCYACADR